MNDALALLNLPPERIAALVAVLAAVLAALRIAGRVLGPVVLRRAPRLHAALAAVGAVVLALGPDVLAALRAAAARPVPPGERITQPDPIRPPRLPPPLPLLLVLVLVALGAGCATTEQREQTASTVGLVYRTVRKVCGAVMALPAPSSDPPAPSESGSGSSR